MDFASVKPFDCRDSFYGFLFPVQPNKAAVIRIIKKMEQDAELLLPYPGFAVVSERYNIVSGD